MIKFREDFVRAQVVIYSDDQVVWRHKEYRGAAIWAQRAYNLTDAQMLDIYQDYKEDSLGREYAGL